MTAFICKDLKIKSRLAILLALFTISSGLFSQVIVPSSDSLLFPSTNVGDKDSLQLTLTNTAPNNLQVTNVKFYTIYNDFPFSASESSFIIPAGGSYSIWVYFEPVHNVLNNSEMVILHSLNSGAESIDLRGQGVFPNPYYNVTQNLEEQALKTALNNRLGVGYNQLSYTAARDNMYATIDNVNGQVECVYTGRVATFSTRAGANSNSFNCEHTFPQSMFGGTQPMRADIHHLFPTDAGANSRRSNHPFAVVPGNGSWTQGGSKLGSGIFEPRDAQKGRSARAMLYFVIRYQDYSGFFAPQENLLRNWHNAFPPDSAERVRNNDIFAIQNNRNPFIDYPQLEERITNFATNSVSPVINGQDILQTSINFGTFINQQADTFEYVIVNRGNRPITYSNFNLSDPNILSFSTGFGPTVVVAPGDALIIPVIVQTSTTQSLVENLSFNTSIPGGQSSFTIPIRGNSVVVSLAEHSLKQSIHLYPNPVGDQLNIQMNGAKADRYRLFDLQGRVLSEGDLKNQEFQQIDFSNLSKGSYLIELQNQSERITYRLLK